jgi:hypothetical protein
MKATLFLLITILSGSQIVAKSTKTKRKTFQHQVSIYWGWNRAYFTKSNLHLKGSNYDFTLQKIVAKDRQSPFSINQYFNPLEMTIPQYNFRVAYFFKHNWQISVGFDHMKYVMKENQIVQIDGEIHESNSNYNGIFQNDSIKLTDDFLSFEHTDGLNYANIEMRRMDNLFEFLNPKIELNSIVGAGAGIMTPKTNTHLMNYKRYDEWHLAGYGFSSIVGFNLSIYKFFFVQSELKAGFINMPDIRTTEFNADRGQQHFWYLQRNLVFGFRYTFR